MATSNNALISVRQLTKEFRRGVVALDHCDLEVYRGEVVAIIGPSGSGKSTLLRSLNLLEQPTSGAIYFDGADLADKSVNIDLHRQKMGMVFQHFNLFPHKRWASPVRWPAGWCSWPTAEFWRRAPPPTSLTIPRIPA